MTAMALRISVNTCGVLRLVCILTMLVELIALSEWVTSCQADCIRRFEDKPTREKCLSELLESALDHHEHTQTTQDGAMCWVEGLFLGEYITDCRALAYDVGVAGFEHLYIGDKWAAFPSVTTAFQDCSPLCSKGCYFGAVSAFVQAAGTSVIPAVAMQVCQTVTDSDACAIGIGYGLSNMRSVATVSDALVLCQRMGPFNDLCAQGVITEYVNLIIRAAIDKEDLAAVIPTMCVPLQSQSPWMFTMCITQIGQTLRLQLEDSSKSITNNAQRFCDFLVGSTDPVICRDGITALEAELDLARTKQPCATMPLSAITDALRTRRPEWCMFSLPSPPLPAVAPPACDSCCSVSTPLPSQDNCDSSPAVGNVELPLGLVVVGAIALVVMGVLCVGTIGYKLAMRSKKGAVLQPRLQRAFPRAFNYSHPNQSQQSVFDMQDNNDRRDSVDVDHRTSTSLDNDRSTSEQHPHAPRPQRMVTMPPLSDGADDSYKL